MELPKIGVGVFVKRSDDKLILMRRQNSHGAGMWALPGGHLEFGEEIEHCAKREVMEELGVNVKSVKVLGITNDIMTKENKHYVTIFVDSEIADGETPNIMEPEKTTEIVWV